VDLGHCCVRSCGGGNALLTVGIVIRHGVSAPEKQQLPDLARPSLLRVDIVSLRLKELLGSTISLLKTKFFL
jgi:hypothetical protein